RDLPPALRRGALPAAALGRRLPASASAAAGRRVRHVADHGRLTRRDVEAITLAVLRVVERLAVAAPRRRKRSRLDGRRNLFLHFLILLVARHRLEPVLRDRGGQGEP